MWEMLGKVADIASVVSLIVSGYAAWQITEVRRKIGRRIAFTALADEFLDKVESSIKYLREAIQCYPEKRGEIDSDIMECVALLGTNSRELPREGLAALSELRKLANNHRNTIADEANKVANDDLALLWNIHGLIRICLVEYQNVVSLRRKGVVDDL